MQDQAHVGDGDEIIAQMSPKPSLKPRPQQQKQGL
jgi:hypothetical protein